MWINANLPPEMREHFAPAEYAILELVKAETKRNNGTCTKSVGDLARIAGVCRTTVKNALRKANAVLLVASRQRPINRRYNRTNVIKVVYKRWLSWATPDGVRQMTGKTIIESSFFRPCPNETSMSMAKVGIVTRNIVNPGAGFG